MKNLSHLFSIFFLISVATLLINCNNDDDSGQQTLTPSEILASTAWETTDAKDNKGNQIALENENVINFVGFAYFKIDGTFTMFNLDDTSKMQGDWSVSPDGKTRTIVAKNNLGDILFTRVVDITVLTKNEFTYRIYPNSNDLSIYYDIIHTPTNHSEPN